MRFIDVYTDKISTLHDIKKDYEDDAGLQMDYKDFTRKEVNRIIGKLYAHAMKD